MTRANMAKVQHPISLERVFFTRSIVVAIPDYRPGSDNPPQVEPDNHINTKAIPETPGRFMVTMTSLVNQAGDPGFPYTIDMECIGIFTVDGSLAPDEAARGVTVTGNSVLYGAIREATAWITGRQPYGQLILGLSILQPPEPPPES